MEIFRNTEGSVSDSTSLDSSTKYLNSENKKNVAHVRIEEILTETNYQRKRCNGKGVPRLQKS